MMMRATPLLLMLLVLLRAAPAHADERRYMMAGFDRIRIDGPFEVTVVPGTSAGAIASGERRALDSVDVRVQGTTLIVSASLNAWGGYPGAARSIPRVTVTAASLRSATMIGGGRLTIDRMRGARIDLALTGAGTLVVTDAQADRIDATLLGTGQITIGGRALQGRFQSNGAGAIDARAMQVGALSVTWQSAGDGRFFARNTAAIVAAGQGAITVDGAPACTVSGSGPVICGKK